MCTAQNYAPGNPGATPPEQTVNSDPQTVDYPHNPPAAPGERPPLPFRIDLKLSLFDSVGGSPQAVTIYQAISHYRNYNFKYWLRYQSERDYEAAAYARKQDEQLEEVLGELVNQMAQAAERLDDRLTYIERPAEYCRQQDRHRAKQASEMSDYLNWLNMVAE